MGDASAEMAVATEDGACRHSRTSRSHSIPLAGVRLIKHARYYWRLLAESYLTRRLFEAMVGRIAALPVATG